MPTLVDGDYVLWESNSIMRYLCMAYGKGIADLSACAEARAPPSTAGSTGRCRRCSRSTARCSGRWCARRRRSATWSQIQKDADAEAVVWPIAERQLATRRFIEGDQFTIADIAVGAYARRWLGVEGITKPKLPHLERWFARVRGAAGICRNSSRRRCRDQGMDAGQRDIPSSRPLTGADARRAPPIFMQVLVPSILTKPAPYAAQELADARPFNGSGLSDVAALVGLLKRTVRLLRQREADSASGER